MSFLVSTGITLVININHNVTNKYYWYYFISLVVLSSIWVALRQYSSKNAMKLYESLLFLAERD
ncbi:hypothetical protein ACZ11_09665 [Lysinibacillus xylanilyticus]|uniref:Uncharacterized protein n=1 Tax=Lysinibacillus xylanilyticus TaxID=582475 RepID=A0A0K9FE13_9BACI|nr:hypothetical protein ACZ11_09665 [Lysinibacillus xylanilyticus]